MSKTTRISDKHHSMVKEIIEEYSGIGNPNIKDVIEKSVEELHEDIVGEE